MLLLSIIKQSELRLLPQMAENNSIINQREQGHFVVTYIQGAENRKSSVMSPDVQLAVCLLSGSGRSSYSQSISLKLKA